MFKGDTIILVGALEPLAKGKSGTKKRKQGPYQPALPGGSRQTGVRKGRPSARAAPGFSGGVYCRIWEGEGSRDRRSLDFQDTGGTATGEVVPGQAVAWLQAGKLTSSWIITANTNKRSAFPVIGHLTDHRI